MDGSMVFAIGGASVHLYLIMLPWAHPSPKRKRHLDRFSWFCRAHYCDRQTDRPTDHATRSV